MTPEDNTPETHGDDQERRDTDPVDSSVADSRDDPAHDTEEDEGWTSEGGATPEGPATDT